MVHDASVSTSAKGTRPGHVAASDPDNPAHPGDNADAGTESGADQDVAGGLEYTEAVFAVAALIPPGKVLSYGDIAELLGSGGPRQVGAAMAGSADHVCWWRVIRADGTLRDDLQARALGHWEAEETVRRSGRVVMKQARWQPDEAAHRRIDVISASLPVTSLAKRHLRLI